ncbi:hypothetical protein EPD60_08815 [Flaviaesturariibacter flavus]|uniref:Lipocalin-like domain-containing protein n=1 Tax=Flaviaesturariibacter flavus TaxID=2502780 RepID=A0A4V2NVM4_9BACT|nr:hypothetical protein [Flaviaesturariibacter flavus]TCJ14102.1 hypothetical protein EPD60_08815 [Flaviaesturariibacter flavus]
MRKLLLLALVATIGCSRENSRSELMAETAAAPAPIKDPAALVGSWQRFETFRDPGDGSGTWQPVTGDDITRVTFGAGGEFTASSNSSLAPYTRYTPNSGRELRLFGGHGDSLTVFFETDGQVLQLIKEARETAMDRYRKL